MPSRVERGTTLGGRFRLEELIGGGAMGSVYAAFDRERGHRVAVKVLSQRLARRTESEPVAANTKPDGSDSPKGRARNRRVEIRIPNA